VGNLYRRLAAALGEQGIASLRIDFRGWGESAGKMEESTIQTQIDDAATAYEYLKELSFVDPARIGVVGFSLGGGIAVVSAAQLPKRYAALVTWSSVGNFKADFMSLGQENFDRAAKEGVVTIDLGWREVTLGHGFFTSLELYGLQEEIKKYPGSFLAIAGSEDFSNAYTDSYVAGAAGSKKEAFILEGADHIFGVLGEDQSTAEQVLQKTVEWFGEKL
ncbi:MAG: prolyl oligopeptidase family serine peptidase, partial [bacterium]|nr:prolyl oligopeptidase family serine peptidase [bacterium]